MQYNAVQCNVIQTDSWHTVRQRQRVITIYNLGLTDIVKGKSGFFQVAEIWTNEKVLPSSGESWYHT